MTWCIPDVVTVMKEVTRVSGLAFVRTSNETPTAPRRHPDGTLRSTAEAIRNLFEAIVHANKAGLDYFAVGDPDSVAERMVDLHHHMGHMRHFLQGDFGGLPQEHFLEHLTLLATEVKSRATRLLGKK